MVAFNSNGNGNGGTPGALTGGPLKMSLSILPFEFRQFTVNSVQLRRLYSETLKALDDISASGVIPKESLQSLESKVKDLSKNCKLIGRPPCIIVLGQCNRVKAILVNELFGKSHLPVVEENAELNSTSLPWRMVRFKYSKKNQVLLTLGSSYELIEHLHDGNWRTMSTAIRTDDLAIPEEEIEGPVEDCAVVEMHIDHSLLYDNVQIIVPPTGNLDNFAHIVKTISETTTPILLYGISEDILSNKDVWQIHLGQLRSFVPTIPTFYVHLPSSENDNYLTEVDQNEFRNHGGLNFTTENEIKSNQKCNCSNSNGCSTTTNTTTTTATTTTTTSGGNEKKYAFPSDTGPSKKKKNKKKNETENQSEPIINNENSKILEQLISLGLIGHEKKKNFGKKKSKKEVVVVPLGSGVEDENYFWTNQQENSTTTTATTTATTTSSNMRFYGATNTASEYIPCLDQLPRLSQFVRKYLQSQFINAAKHLHKVHTNCLQMFILSAFEMAREMQITPKRLDYARQKETELLANLMDIAEKKQSEMSNLIALTIGERREDILQKAEMYQFSDPQVRSCREGPVAGKLVSLCIDEIRELVALDLNNIIAQKLINSVYCLHDTFLGTLERCVSSLEKTTCTDLDDGSSLASVALKQILTAAYQVEVPHQSASLLRGLYDKMIQLINSLPWSSVPAVDGHWRRSVAADMLDSLSNSRLAKAICCQLKERLRTSHDSFSTALRQLELHHNERLERTGEQGFRLRKVHAPRLARLALETSSIIDCLRFGMPQCGREIGRGQYGVVYACDSWAGFVPCAVKSVVPMDDKHWNDLAMEFYYMRSIPQHDRIVRVHGSVIDHSYAGGTIPAVLIVMDRLTRDLYCALKDGLPFGLRLQIALDVVAGIRYLHSQGLVHRDIKMKNILLDTSNRAKLTDLGFCKPEAMMSGSIVGTPIHMAPELFTGQYDSSVDVYAFGILFWYLCAGKIKLPQTFEQCPNKEILWARTKKGTRPERLSFFDDECWKLMDSCWAGEPCSRPLLGYVEPKLESIKENYEKLRIASQEYSLSSLSSLSDEPLIMNEVTSDILGASPYLNIEYPIHYKPNC